jgi:hypothetical protein
VNRKADRHMILKCGSTAELEHWKRALDSEANPGKVPDGKGGFTSHDGAEKKAVPLRDRSSALIYDIGGASIRAGFAGNIADAPKAWPEVCVCRTLVLLCLTPKALVFAEFPKTGV